MHLRRELLAGLSTFFTMAYLILLYPKILSEGGIDFGAALTASILALAGASLFLAAYANFPALIAPGLTVGPFLIYSVILKEHASWQTALGIVFWVGLAIFLLSLFKIRQKILLHLPLPIKSSAICGMGLFLICVGLKDLGILIPTDSFFKLGPIATLPNGIAFCGLLIFFLLHRMKVASAFLTAIFTGWIAAILFGLTKWNGLAAFPPSISPTLFQLDLWTPFKVEWLGTVLSVLLICLFDTSASLAVLSKMAHTVDKKGKIKQIDRIVIPDGIGSMAGALLGTGTLAFILESSSGIKAGGRTGVTAAVAALCCLIGLFFYPLISSIPLFAAVPALIAIGIFMTQEVKLIEWKDITQSIPAILTLVAIPVTFSIYQGFALGFLSYSLLMAAKGRRREVHPISWTLTLVFALHFVWLLTTAVLHRP